MGVEVSCEGLSGVEMELPGRVQKKRWKSDEIDALGTMWSMAFPFGGSSGPQRAKQKGALITALAGSLDACLNFDTPFSSIAQTHHLFPSTTTTAPRPPRPLGSMPRHLTTAPSPLKLLVAALTRPASRSPAVPPLPSRLWCPHLSSYLGDMEARETGQTGGGVPGVHWGARRIDQGEIEVAPPRPPRKLSPNVAKAGRVQGLDPERKPSTPRAGGSMQCLPWPGRNVGDGSRGGSRVRGSTNRTRFPPFRPSPPSQVNRDVTPASSPEPQRASSTGTETTSPAHFPLGCPREPARTAARLCRPNHHSHRHLDEQDLGRRPHAITRPPWCAIPPSLPPSAPALLHNSTTRPNAGIATHRQHWQGRRLSEPAETAAGVGLRGMSQAQAAM